MKQINPVVLEYRFKEAIVNAAISNGMIKDKNEEEFLSKQSPEALFRLYLIWIGISADYAPTLMMLMEQLQRASSPFLTGTEISTPILLEHLYQYIDRMCCTHEADSNVDVTMRDLEGIPSIEVRDYRHDGPNRTGFDTLIRFHDRS